MSDHREEQEMEAEALAAIFDTAFEIKSSTQPFEWSVKLLPVDCGGDPDEEEAQNHVGIHLLVNIPLDYPETSLPELNIEIIKGLTEEHRTELVEMAKAEAANNEGMPMIFTICEVLREWLLDHNRKGLDDASMHAQMMRRAQEEERKKVSCMLSFIVGHYERVPARHTGRHKQPIMTIHCVTCEIEAWTRSLRGHRPFTGTPSRRFYQRELARWDNIWCYSFKNA